DPNGHEIAYTEIHADKSAASVAFDSAGHEIGYTGTNPDGSWAQVGFDSNGHETHFGQGFKDGSSVESDYNSAGGQLEFSSEQSAIFIRSRRSTRRKHRRRTPRICIWTYRERVRSAQHS